MNKQGKAGDQTWFIIFTKTNYHHWVFNIVSRERQHCYAVKKSRGGQYWIVLNGRRSHLDLEIEPLSIYPSIMDLIDEGDEVLQVRVRYNPLARNTQLCIMTCTDIVKRALGITDWLCWSPHQLYKRITRGNYEQNIKSWRSSRKEVSRTAEACTSSTTDERRTAVC